jgi:hypothetical protein
MIPDPGWGFSTACRIPRDHLERDASEGNA